MWELISGVDFYGVNRKILRSSSNLKIMFYGFLKEKKHILANSRKDGLVHSRYNIAYPIILLFLFLLTILNQTQYWSMLIVETIYICVSDIERDSKFKGSEVFTIHKRKPHGRNI
jgi:hypothetical protein